MPRRTMVKYDVALKHQVASEALGGGTRQCDDVARDGYDLSDTLVSNWVTRL